MEDGQRIPPTTTHPLHHLSRGTSAQYNPYNPHVMGRWCRQARSVYISVSHRHTPSFGIWIPVGLGNGLEVLARPLLSQFQNHSFDPSSIDLFMVLLVILFTAQVRSPSDLLRNSCQLRRNMNGGLLSLSVHVRRVDVDAMTRGLRMSNEVFQMIKRDSHMIHCNLIHIIHGIKII